MSGEELKKSRAEMVKLRAEKSFSEELDKLPSDILSSTAKNLARVFYRRYDESNTRWNVLTGKNSVEKLADEIGQKEGSVYTALHNLESMGAISLRSDYDKGLKRNHPTMVRFHESFWHPRLLISKVPPEKKRNQGGDRPGSGRPKKCNHCGSENIVFSVKVHCKECGRDWNYEVNKNQVDSLVAPDHQHGENQLDSPETEELIPQHALNRLYQEIRAGETENQVDSSEHETENQVDSSEQLGDVNPNIVLHPQVALSQNEQSPSSPPSGIPDHVHKAALYLLKVNGSANSYIEMNDNPEYPTTKYWTEQHKLHYGKLLAHLKGYHTYGSLVGLTLWASEPYSYTYALCFDKDDETGLQLLRVAGKKLEQAGFTVFLDISPVGHGGHLWILFHGEVHTYSARETVLEIAPELRDCLEYWPCNPTGNHIRLPGGLYVKPDGFKAWCTLEDPNGTLLARNGEEAAAVILERQNSPALVKLHVKPKQKEEKPQAQEGGLFGLSAQEQERSSKPIPCDGDVAAYLIAEFNKNTSWEDLLGSPQGEKYYAVWRGDRNPNVHVYDTDRAVDYSCSSWLGRTAMDKYQVYCLIEGGQDWQAWRKRDLAARCEAYRKSMKQLVSKEVA